MIILAALTAGAWLLFPSKVEQNATRIANWATDEAKPMINDVLEDGADAFDDPELDRTEQERIEEEEDPETLEAVPEEDAVRAGAQRPPGLREERPVAQDPDRRGDRAVAPDPGRALERLALVHVR